MTQEFKNSIIKCYNAVQNRVNEINDFVKLLKHFNGGNLQPIYTTCPVYTACGPRRELIGNVGMQFDFALTTNVGILVFTLFANNGNKDLELWESVEFHPTEQSGCLCLLTIVDGDIECNCDYEDGYIPIN